MSLTILLYLVVSSAMLVLNKLALIKFQLPYTLTLLQSLIACIIVLCLSFLGYVKLQVAVGVKFVVPSLVWALPLAFNMQTLHYLNPETAVVFRTATLVGVSLGDLLYFSRIFKGHEISAISIIVLGAIIYAKNDLHYDHLGYVWATCYWATMTASLLVIKAAFNANREVGNLEKTFYLNCFGSSIFVILSLLFERNNFADVMQSLNVWTSVIVCLSCFLGLVLGFLASVTRDKLSATSFDVLSNISKFLTLGLSAVIFKTRYTSLSLFGLVVVLIGGALYSPVAYRIIHDYSKNNRSRLFEALERGAGRKYELKSINFSRVAKSTHFIIVTSFSVVMSVMCLRSELRYLIHRPQFTTVSVSSSAILSSQPTIKIGHTSQPIHDLTQGTHTLSIGHIMAIDTSEGTLSNAVRDDRVKNIQRILQSIRTSSKFWIDSYDHSHYELIVHANLGATSRPSSKPVQEYLSNWHNAMNSDKREMMYLTANAPDLERIIGSLVMTQADIAVVLQEAHVPNVKHWAQPYVDAFEIDPLLGLVSIIGVASKNSPVVFIRRSALVSCGFVPIARSADFLRKATNDPNPIHVFITRLSTDLLLSGWRVAKTNGGALSFQYEQSSAFTQTNHSSISQRNQSKRTWRGSSGLVKRAENAPRSELFNLTGASVSRCHADFDVNLRYPKPPFGSRYAPDGISHVTSAVNKHDLIAIKSSKRVSESSLSVTLAIEFFKHKDNVQPLLRAYRRIMANRDLNGNRDRLIFLDDGGYDGTFEVLIASLQGEKEQVIAMNNIEQIRAYTRSFHATDTDIWAMLQDDDLPPEKDTWLRPGLKMFDAHPRLGAINFLCAFTTPEVYGNTWGHCRANQGIPTIDPCTGQEFMFTVAGDSSPILYRRSALDSVGGLLFSWNAPIQKTNLEYTFATDVQLSYMVGAEAEVSFRLWRAGWAWGTMRAPGIKRSFGGKSTYHNIDRDTALRKNLPDAMKWRRYHLWRQRRRMIREMVSRYSLEERKHNSDVVKLLNQKLLCRRPLNYTGCSIFAKQRLRKTPEQGQKPESAMISKMILNAPVKYKCPIDILAVISDNEMIGQHGLFKSRPWPGNQGSWVRCGYEDGDVFWWQGKRFEVGQIVVTRETDWIDSDLPQPKPSIRKGWIPSWLPLFLNLRSSVE